MVGTWIKFQSEKIGGNYGIVLKKLMLFKFFYFKHCWYISPKCINTWASEIVSYISFQNIKYIYFFFLGNKSIGHLIDSFIHSLNIFYWAPTVESAKVLSDEQNRYDSLMIKILVEETNNKQVLIVMLIEML